MARGIQDLSLVIALAFVGMGAALLPGVPELVRAPLALALVLALPGYALIAALNPRRAGGAVERAVLALGASVALTVLAGLLLNLTPWGLRRESWAVLLATLTVLAAGVAVARRRSLAPEAPEEPQPPLQLQPAQAALLAVAALLLVAAVSVARLGADVQPNEGFTQLWMQEAAGAPGTLRLGVSNQEAEPMRYLLRVTAGERVLGEWTSIELQPGAAWEITETLAATPPAGTPVEATLYRADEPDRAYRSVVLWLGAEAGEE